MKLSFQEKFLVALIMGLAVTTGVSFRLQNIKTFFPSQTIIAPSASSNVVKVSLPKYVPPEKLANSPEIIKAVYVTGYSAGTKSYLNYLTDLFKTTEINTVVVNIKGSEGSVSYASGVPDVEKYNLYNGAIRDIDALVKFFHDQNIYVIGRIAVFEDPLYSKARPELAIYNKTLTTDFSQPVLWQDNNKLSWLDPSSKDVWDYNISLAKDAIYHGFDEINFDYVRFPTDGKMENMGFPVWDGKVSKSQTIKEFFTYTRQQLIGEKISVDLFGETTVDAGDMGIGQAIENAFENFDYISPMVYPSHYRNGFLGFENPAEHPYEIIKYSMDGAVAKENIFSEQEKNLAKKSREANLYPVAGLLNVPAFELQSLLPAPTLAPLAKFRPWLQDFNMGADYTADMIKQEIKATQDSLGADYNGYMLWSSSNIYTQDAVSKQ